MGPDVLELSRKLISIDTTNPPGTQRELVDYLAGLFQEHGIPAETHLIDGMPSLFAILEFPNPGSSLCWVGHWDVVPSGPTSQWTITQPFVPKTVDGHLYGRGACDMKTGVAAAISAALELRKAAGCGQLVLAILADEECGGFRGGAPLLKKYHEKFAFDYAIVGEPTNFELKTSRRGACWGRITLFGLQAHAARPDEGDNPILKMGLAISALTDMCMSFDKSHPARPTLSVTTARAGDKDNIIPHEATIGFDIRTVPSQTIHSLKEDIHKTLQSCGLTSDSDYELSLNWIADPYETTDMQFIETCRLEAAACIGRTPELTWDGGTSDGRFLAELGVPVVEFGLENATLHKVNENCPVKSIRTLEAVYLRLLKRLLCLNPLEFTGKVI